MSRRDAVIEIERGRVVVGKVPANEAGPWPPEDRVMVTVIRDFEEEGTIGVDACMSDDEARELMDAIAWAVGCFSDDGAMPKF